MSSNIWTQCAGDSELRPLSVEPYRVVEAQHQVATRKLVDSAAEQVVLEELLEGAKPPDLTRGQVHYLLATPFRYPPLTHGSRFGVKHEPGIWYGSETLVAAFAETAYYRLLFLEGTRAKLGTVRTMLTSFRVRVRTERGIDLTVTPFDRHRRLISSKSRYTASQALGTAMRSSGVELFRYRSARDHTGGINVGVFTPRVFRRRRPVGLQNWYCAATVTRVEMQKQDYFARAGFAFSRDEFEVSGRLPAPAP
jgi:RES domain